MAKIFQVQTTKTPKKNTALMRKDAGHSRTSHCFHGTVRQDNQRSPSRLKYHVCDLDVFRAGAEIHQPCHKRQFNWSRPLAWNFHFCTRSNIWPITEQTGTGKFEHPPPLSSKVFFLLSLALFYVTGTGVQKLSTWYQLLNRSYISRLTYL